MLSDNLDVDTVAQDLAGLKQAVVVRHDIFGEAELAGDEDLLTARELELGTTESFPGVVGLVQISTDGEEDLTNVDTGRLAESLTERTTHTLLESIGTGARKHLVDADDVPRVNSDSQMEVVTTAVDDHVLVGGNTGRLQSLRRNLLLLVADKMDAGRELVIAGLLLATVVHTNLGIWHTTVEAGLRVGLILLVPIAPRGSSSH